MFRFVSYIAFGVTVVTVCHPVFGQSEHNSSKTMSSAEPSASKSRILPPVIVESDADKTVTTAGDVKGYRALTGTSATQTDTPLRQIPRSIKIIPRSVMDDQSVMSIEDALQNVSGAVGQKAIQTPIYSANYIRGFTAEQYLDGMTTYIGSGDSNALANVERIEVLKGPSAILYGGGAGTPTGGVVNVISKMPTAQTFYELGGTIGSNGYYAPYFDVNQPLNANKTVLFRGTGSYVKSGSDIDVIETDRYSINPTLLLTNNDDTTLTLQGRLSRWEQQEYQGLPAVGTVSGGFRLDREMYIGDPDIPDSYSDAKGITASLDHEFNDVWSFGTKFRYAKSSYNQLTQLFTSNTPNVGASSWQLYNSLVEEERDEVSVSSHALAEFSSGDFKSKLMFGADFSRMSEQLVMKMDGPVGTVDLLSPGAWPDYTSPSTVMSDLDASYRTYGGFTQLQTTYADRLHFLAGLRLSSLDMEQYIATTKSTDNTRDTKLLPSLGVVVDLTKQVSLFADYSEGLKGNPGYSYAGPAQPETSSQYEAGVKFNFDNGVSGTAAVFQIDRSKVPVSNPNDAFGLTSLAIGEQRSRGFDADLTWQPDDHWKVLANYGYVDVELVEDIPNGAKAGSKLPFIAQHSGGLWVDYTFGSELLKGWSIGAGPRAASGAPLELGKTYKTKPYIVADAAIRYKNDDGFSVNLAMKNLTDEEYYLPYQYFTGSSAAAPGRSVYLTLSQRF